MYSISNTQCMFMSDSIIVSVSDEEDDEDDEDDEDED